MFADLDVTKITKVEFLNESIDKKNFIHRYYDVHLNNGKIERLLFILLSEKEGLDICGCQLILDKNDEHSRSETLKYEDALYVANEFKLFPPFVHLQKEVVFICRKCNHHLFVSDIGVEKLAFVSEYDCPNCGEEGYRNWILSHIGDSEEEKNNYEWT